VRSGETSEADVALEAGCQKTVRIKLEGEKGPVLVQVSVLDSDRQSVAEYHVSLHGPSYDLVLSHRPGRYTVEASTKSGRRASTAFEIERSSSAEVIELLLP
jgi:hypothetical protein